MKAKLSEKLKVCYAKLEKKLAPIIKPARAHLGKLRKGVRTGAVKPQIAAYNLLGDKTAKFIPLFKDLDKNLERSEIKITFKAYVSLTILASLAVSLSALILTPIILYFFLGVPVFSSLLFGLGISMLSGAFTVIAFYAYPIYKADSLKRKLEDELPFAAGYMAVLAGSGVTSDKIFKALARIDVPLAITQEAKRIVRDVELFGADLISALESASKRSPSEKFKQFLQGFIATTHSGGSLVAYLLDRSRYYMRLKKIAIKKFADTLSLLSEFYVAILVAGPLLFVIMLAVMAMLGGGGMGLLDPKLLLYLLTYIAIPVASVIFIIILDVLSPRW
ncbi:type II secretion system F family protein [Candidatus Bathyarchaeota archaeon]|nr:type II secretion system F family protein [Candidatus Bathyarchaeota archaeon]